MKTAITILVALITFNVTIAQKTSSHNKLPIKQVIEKYTRKD